MENPTKMDDLEVPPQFRKLPYSITIDIDIDIRHIIYIYVLPEGYSFIVQLLLLTMMILIDNSKCTALLGTWPSMWAPNHEEAQSSPMMDLRALLYVVDKVFKHAERARQSKDPDPLADEAGWTNTGWWKWVTTILGKMTTNQYQSCFFWSIFFEKTIYVKIKLLADPITLEPHCNILQSHLDSSFQDQNPIVFIH